MEIHGAGGIQGPRRIEQKKVNRASELGAAGDLAKPDSVEFSDIARFLEGLSKIPGVRQEKIQAIRQQIERGDYETREKLSVAVERLLEDLTT